MQRAITAFTSSSSGVRAKSSGSLTVREGMPLERFLGYADTRVSLIVPSPHQKIESESTDNIHA